MARARSTVNDNTQTATVGERSTFGHYLTANGGVAPTTNWQGAAGGTGGGGHSPNGGMSGAGGTHGSSGIAAATAPGVGQGNYTNRLTISNAGLLTPGSGGAGGFIAYGHVAGGGGGGVLMIGKGPTGGNGQFSRGGTGYESLLFVIQIGLHF